MAAWNDTKLPGRGFDLLDVGRLAVAPRIVPLVIEGYNADVDNVWETVWTGGTNYVFPPAGGVRMEAISTSAQDGPAGTGILSIMIHYLDANWVEQEETVVLNGLGAVGTTATNILRVNKIHGATFGTGGGAAGTIDLRLFGGGTIWSQIALGDTTSHAAIYSVPAGKRALMLDWAFSAGAAAAGHTTRFSYDTTWDAEHQVVLPTRIGLIQQSVTDGAEQLSSPFGMQFGPQSDIVIKAISDGGAANVFASTFSAGILETL